jgi:hypothetical protein
MNGRGFSPGLLRRFHPIFKNQITKAEQIGSRGTSSSLAFILAAFAAEIEVL